MGQTLLSRAIYESSQGTEFSMFEFVHEFLGNVIVGLPGHHHGGESGVVAMTKMAKPLESFIVQFPANGWWHEP